MIIEKRKDWEAHLDDGFIRFPNLLAEAILVTELSAIQLKIMVFILRRTYGWNSRDDVISMGDIAKVCHADRIHVTRQMNELIQRNMIRRVSSQPGKMSEYEIVANVAEWDPRFTDLETLEYYIGQNLFDNYKIRNRWRKGCEINYLSSPQQAAMEQIYRNRFYSDDDS